MSPFQTPCLTLLLLSYAPSPLPYYLLFSECIVFVHFHIQFPVPSGLSFLSSLLGEYLLDILQLLGKTLSLLRTFTYPPHGYYFHSLAISRGLHYSTCHSVLLLSVYTQKYLDQDGFSLKVPVSTTVVHNTCSVSVCGMVLWMGRWVNG